MTDGWGGGLAVAAIVAALVGFRISQSYLSRRAAALVTLIKVSIPLVYFSMVFEGRPTLHDDGTYFEAGRRLVSSGFSAWSLIFEESGRLALVVAGGRHTSYVWWNVLTQDLFGSHYFAPVFGNVMLSFLAGAWVFRLARRGDVSRRYAAALATTFVLHWDLMTWSSLVNLKDTLVLTLTVGQIVFVLDLVHRFRVRSALSLLALALVLYLTRFYALLFTGCAALAWTMLRSENRRLRVIAPLAGLALVVVGAGVGANLRYIDTSSVTRGVFRFLLTPRPWDIDPQYGFLEPAAVLHWIFMPFAVGAAVSLWRRSEAARFVLLHAAAATAFYALVPALQGPRHRLQIVLALAWLQFHGLWEVTRTIAPARMSRRVLRRRAI